MDMKKRSTNFQATEIDLLIQLIKKYWKELESKKSNTSTWKQKQDCWEILANEFNAQNISIENRSAHVLKKKWDNYKKQVKSKIATEKIYCKGTGGGPSFQTALTANEQEILNLINIQATGNPSIYDCDADLDDNNKEGHILGKRISDDKWDNYCPSQLKKPVSEPLKFSPEAGPSNVDFIVLDIDEGNESVQVNKENPTVEENMLPTKVIKTCRKKKNNTIMTNKKWCEVADRKKELISLKTEKLKIEIKNLEEKHKIEMKNLDELHKIQVEILKTELDIKRKQLNQ